MAKTLRSSAGWLGSLLLIACADDASPLDAATQDAAVMSGHLDSGNPPETTADAAGPHDGAMSIDATVKHDAAAEPDASAMHDAAELHDGAQLRDAAELQDAASGVDASDQDAAMDAGLIDDAHVLDDAHVSDDASHADAAAPLECAEALTISVAGGEGYDRAHAVTIDGEGAAYVTGLFSGTAEFGATTLTALGETDVFVAKLTAAGEFAWVRRAGGAGADEGHSIAALEDGSVYVTGFFTDEATFGSQEVIGGDAGASLFIAHYDPAGSLAWVRAVSGTAACGGESVAASPDGAAYVAGSFTGTCSFETTMLTSEGASDAFLAKYAPDGALAWAVRAGGGFADAAHAVAVRADGSAVVTGEFRVGAQFGSVMLVGADFSYDFFIARYDDDGSVLWAEQAGGSSPFDNYAFGSGVAIDAEGNAYVTGGYGGTVRFGAHTLMADEASFVAKYAEDGAALWAQTVASGISVAAAGGVVYAAGGVQLGYPTLGAELYLATLDAATGSTTRTQRASASGSSYPRSYGRGLAASESCHGYVTGSFSQTWTFGGQTFTSTGDEDIFIARSLQPAP